LKIEANASGDNLSYQWYKDGVSLSGEVNEYYIVPVSAKSDGGVYHVEVSGVCGAVKSPPVTIDIMSESLLVEKWHDVILVDNSRNEFCEYQWYRDGKILPGAKEQFYQEVGGLKGCYSVDLTQVKGSTIRSCEHCVDKTQKNNFSLYPNPVKDRLYIQSSLVVEQVSIYDISGRLLKQFVNPASFVDTDDLAAGIYIVKIKTIEGESIHKTIKN
jgi:hypothetical protein